MILYVPVKTVSEANARGHWARRHERVRAQRSAVKLVWHAAPWRERAHIELDAGLVVTITRVAPRALDEGDNVASSVKACRDELAVLLGLPLVPRGRSRRTLDIADDRDPRVTWRVEQRKGEPGEYAVEVRIEPRAA